MKRGSSKSKKSTQMKSKSKTKSNKKNLTSKSNFNEALSCSAIGASTKPESIPMKKSKTKTAATSIVDTASVLLECKKIHDSIQDQKMVKCISMKDMNRQGYKVDIKNGKDNLFSGSGPPNNRSMIVKIINLKLMTGRYRKNFEEYSVKIYKFIGKKPLCKSFPKVYEIFLIEKVYLIYMESFKMKTLYDLIVEKQSIPAATIKQWIKQITEAICVLQQYGIAHRFLKLKHIIIDNGHVKILGWSKAVLFWDNQKNRALKQHKEKRIHKNNFLPPECFIDSYDPSKADVWSLGTIIVSLLTHHYPFHVRARMNFIEQWRAFTKKHSLDPIAKELCDKIFVQDPKKRIKAGAILRDKFFKNDIMITVQKPESKTSKSLSKDKSSSQKKSKTKSISSSTSKSSSKSKGVETSCYVGSKFSSKTKSGEQSKKSQKTKTSYLSTNKLSTSAIGGSQNEKKSTSKSSSSSSSKEIEGNSTIQKGLTKRPPSLSSKQIEDNSTIQQEPTKRPPSIKDEDESNNNNETEELGTGEIGNEDNEEEKMTEEEMQAEEEKEESAAPSEADEASNTEVNQEMVEAASALSEQQQQESSTNENDDSNVNNSNNESDNNVDSDNHSGVNSDATSSNQSNSEQKESAAESEVQTQSESSTSSSAAATSESNSNTSQGE